jgi:RimK family alpha-L-glutamate ligase
MKVALVTTLPGLSENKRIEEEVKALGYGFELIDLRDFRFSVRSGKLDVSGLRELKTDIAVVRGIFISVKAISTIVNHYRKNGVKIFDNNFLEHRYAIDKVTDLVKLSLAGIPVADMEYRRELEHFEKAADKIGYPVIVKSSRSGKGAGVFKVESKDQLKKLVGDLEREGKKAKSYIIQEFIDYKYDLRCLVVGNDVFTMRRIPSEGEFRANFSLGGRVEVFDLDKKGKELALTAMKAIDMSVGGVDILIAKDDKRYVLEVNHTAGFVGMEKATGKNIGKVYVQHAIASAK